MNDNNNLLWNLQLLNYNQNRMMKLKEIELTSKTPEEAARKLNELNRNEEANMKLGIIGAMVAGIIMFLYLASQGVF